MGSILQGQNSLDTPKRIPFFFFLLSGLKQLFYLAHSSVGQEFGQDLPRCLPDAGGLKGPISKMASSRRCQHAFLFHFGLHFGITYKHFQNSGIFKTQDIPGGPVAKTPHSQPRGLEFHP